jgi:hypothetical protein
MTKRSRREWPPPTHVPPPAVQHVHRPGDRRTSDPFYQFRLLARDDGKPFRSPEPKAEVTLLSLLASKAALVVMGCVLTGVVAILLSLLLVRVF